MKTTTCSVLAVVSFFVICVVASCGSSVSVPDAARCANIDLPAAARRWEVFETTSIDGWVKRVKRSAIFKTISRNIYEVVDAVILPELEARPDVIILTDGRIYKVFIRGVDEPLLCRKLNRSNPPHPRPEPRFEPAEPCYVWRMTK